MRTALRSLSLLVLAAVASFLVAAQCQRPVVQPPGTGGAPAAGGSPAAGGGVIAAATGGALEPPPLPCECDKAARAKRMAAAHPRRPTKIVGGVECTDCPPAVASVQGPDGWHYCTGTLVAQDVVLTAAHCQTAPGDQVRVGSRDRTTGGELRKVAASCQHPLYAQNPGWDALLVRLERPVLTRPMALATAIPRSARAMGWGVMVWEGTEIPVKLRAVTLDVPELVDCLNWDPSLGTGPNLCAGTPGKDTCRGDSGGPLAVIQDGDWRLLGVTSRGYRCGIEWGIYTRVPDEPGSPFYDGVDQWVGTCLSDPWP